MHDLRPRTCAPAILALAVCLAVFTAGCGASTTPSAVASTTAPSPTSAGPTTFGAWTARQGFGGSSGFNEINKVVVYLGAHPDYSLYEVDADAADVASLLSWLALHPPTGCWVAYHADATAALNALAADYAIVHAAVAAGRSAPADLTTAMHEISQHARDMAAPANCP